MVEIRRLRQSDVPVALRLVQDAYVRQTLVSPALPDALLCNPALATAPIEEAVANGAVGAVRSGRLIGFMGVSAVFGFKGQRAVLINELSHAAEAPGVEEVYGSMYEALGSLPPLATSRLHIVAHLSGEEALAARLHSLGFGQFLDRKSVV